MAEKIAAKDRVANGLCPNCGKEAAPYRLCWDCRQLGRLTRALKKGQNLGVFNTLGAGKNALWTINKNAPPGASEKIGKWGTPWHLPDTDLRGKPRLRGIRVDVEATLIKVIEFIGRPATIEEIVAAWGRLRDRRSAPLANDLGRIIAAADKRARKAARRAEAWQKSQAGSSAQT
jgi:ribosomal protein S18